MSNPFTTYPGTAPEPRQVLREPVTIDGATGRVIPDDLPRNGCPPTSPFITRKLLEVEPFRLAPWMTPELAEQEIALMGTKGQ